MHDQEQNGDQAQAALDSAKRLSETSYLRGAYPRWFSVATGTWAGTIAALIGLDSPLWFVIMVAGLIGFFAYRHHRGTWVQEIHSWREFFLVVPIGVSLLCGLGFLGIVGWQHFGMFWVPVATGLTIGLLLFGSMEYSMRDARRSPSWS